MFKEVIHPGIQPAATPRRSDARCATPVPGLRRVPRVLYRGEHSGGPQGSEGYLKVKAKACFDLRVHRYAMSAAYPHFRNRFPAAPAV